MATKKNQSLTEDLEFLKKNSKVLLEQAMESNKETISKAISDSLVDDESEGSEFEMNELEGSTEGGEDLEGSNEDMEDMDKDMEDEESEMDDEMSDKEDEEGEESDEEENEFGEDDEEMEDEESEVEDEEETEIKESKVIDMRKASPKMLIETWNKMSEEDEFELVKEDDYEFEETDEEMEDEYIDFSDLDLDGLDFSDENEDLDEQVETGYGKMHEDEEMGEFEKMFFNKEEDHSEEDYSDEDMDLDEEMIHEVGRSYASLRNQRVDQFNTPAKKYSAHRFRPAVRKSKEYLSLKEKYNTLKKENDVLKEQVQKSKQAILETQDNLKKVSRLTALAHYAKELFYQHTTSKKERAYIIESLEKTQTLEEAKDTYKKLNEEFIHKALMTESKNSNRDVLKEAEEKLIKNSGSTSSSGLVKETVAYQEDYKHKRMMDLIHYKGKK